MIKNQMTFPLSVDTATIKATGDVGYSATDAELNAYTIGFIPWEMVEKSLFFRSVQIGDLQGKNAQNQNNYFGYSVNQTYKTTKGVPFCYSYAVNPYTTSINAYRDANDDYINAPWGAASTAGLIHSYDVDTIINNTPATIAETQGIYAMFKMFVLYVPDGVDTSAGVWSSPNGENGWITPLQNKTATIDVLNLTFSVTSSTDSSYMPTAVTFTQNDLLNAENGVMVKENGTTTYDGVTYHIFVHCAITSAFLLDSSSTALKDGIAQLNGIRFSDFGYSDTPYFSSVAVGYIVQNVFTCGDIDNIDIPLTAASGYYIKTSTDHYEYFRGGSNYVNNLLSGGLMENDLKIIRSIARPVYKISGAFYVAEFNDDYTITGNLIPYANARKWQTFINPDENTFDYNDIPEPTPPGGESENIGAKITRPATIGVGGTNGFVTQYALRKADIAELGALLWTSFIDADYWKNYLFSLAIDTGTLNLAGLLNFFLSCKVYPFSMANVAGCSSFGQDMYVGTGVVPLHFSQNIHVLRSTCDYISGGSCTVWSSNFYGDYRDYINTKITLYVPYCGTVELNPGDVVGNQISVQYAVDFSTGGCIAYVDMETGDGAGFPVAALTGQIGADIPLTASAAGAVAARFIGDAMTFGGQISGETSQIAGGVASTMMGKTPSGGSGNVLSGMAGMFGGLPAAVGMDLAPGFAMQAANMLTRSAVSAPILAGGRGFASFGAPQVPYVQIRRGIYPDVSGLGSIAGKPAAGTYTVGELSGFVQGDVKTDGLTCPDSEKSKIRALISSGIYV